MNIPQITMLNVNRNNPNFQRGLPTGLDEANPYICKFLKIAEKKALERGIRINHENHFSVLMSSVLTIGIFDQLKLPSPTVISLTPLKSDTLAAYSPVSDTVYINSNREEFFNLVTQDELEENQGSFHPRTKHFLHSYIHEFMHGAHFKNLIDKHGSVLGVEIWKLFDILKPNNELVQPFNAMLQSRFPRFAGTIEKVSPPYNGTYAKDDLEEYIAEKFSRIVAENLDDNFQLLENPLPLTSAPSDYNIFAEFARQASDAFAAEPKDMISNHLSGFAKKVYDNSKYVYNCIKVFQQDLKYIDADIWNGNLERINERKRRYLLNA